MRVFRIFNQKCFLGFFNILLLLCGVVVLMTGFYLFTDKKRLLLSSLLIVTQDEANPLKDLKHPLFLYVACALTIMGMIMVSFVLFIGCWTSYMNNCCLLSTYFIMVLGLLLMKFALCVIIAMWPQCLGLNVSVSEMVKVMQGSYGVPGYEQYTVAMDFAQTVLECCAINDSINYDTSLWRLQKFGRKELTVPLTCCTLMNRFEDKSYLDPIPVNETQCQSVEPHEFQKSRHLEGCLEKINYWYREHYVVLLCAGLILVLVEFFVLLTIVLNCTRIKQKRIRRQILSGGRSSNLTDSFQRNMTRENIYHDDFVSITPEIRETFVQPIDPRISQAKFSRNNYRLRNNDQLHSNERFQISDRSLNNERFNNNNGYLI